MLALEETPSVLAPHRIMCPKGVRSMGSEHDFHHLFSRRDIHAGSHQKRCSKEDIVPIQHSDSGKPRKAKSHVPGTIQVTMY